MRLPLTNLQLMPQITQVGWKRRARDLQHNTHEFVVPRLTWNFLCQEIPVNLGTTDYSYLLWEVLFQYGRLLPVLVLPPVWFWFSFTGLGYISPQDGLKKESNPTSTPFGLNRAANNVHYRGVDGVVGYRICLTHRRSSVRAWVDS